MIKHCHCKNNDGTPCKAKVTHHVRSFDFCEKHYKHSNMDWKRV